MLGQANVANNNITMINNISKSVKQNTITNTSNSASATSMVKNQMEVEFQKRPQICEGLPANKCTPEDIAALMGGLKGLTDQGLSIDAYETALKETREFCKYQPQQFESVKDAVNSGICFGLNNCTVTLRNYGQSNASAIASAAQTSSLEFKNDIKDAVLNSQNLEIAQANDISGNQISGDKGFLSMPTLGPAVNVTTNRQDITNSVSTAIDQTIQNSVSNDSAAMSLIDNKLKVKLPSCNQSNVSLSNEALGLANANASTDQAAEAIMKNLMTTDLQNQTKSKLIQENEGAEGFFSTGVIIAIVCCCVFPALFISLPKMIAAAKGNAPNTQAFNSKKFSFGGKEIFFQNIWQLGFLMLFLIAFVIFLIYTIQINKQMGINKKKGKDAYDVIEAMRNTDTANEESSTVFCPEIKDGNGRKKYCKLPDFDDIWNDVPSEQEYAPGMYKGATVRLTIGSEQGKHDPNLDIQDNTEYNAIVMDDKNSLMMELENSIRLATLIKEQGTAAKIQDTSNGDAAIKNREAVEEMEANFNVSLASLKTPASWGKWASVDNLPDYQDIPEVPGPGGAPKQTAPIPKPQWAQNNKDDLAEGDGPPMYKNGWLPANLPSLGQQITFAKNLKKACENLLQEVKIIKHLRGPGGLTGPFDFGEFKTQKGVAGKIFVKESDGYGFLVAKLKKELPAGGVNVNFFAGDDQAVAVDGDGTSQPTSVIVNDKAELLKILVYQLTAPFDNNALTHSFIMNGRNPKTEWLDLTAGENMPMIDLGNITPPQAMALTANDPSLTNDTVDAKDTPVDNLPKYDSLVKGGFRARINNGFPLPDDIVKNIVVTGAGVNCGVFTTNKKAELCKQLKESFSQQQNELEMIGIAKAGYKNLEAKAPIGLIGMGASLVLVVAMLIWVIVNVVKASKK